MNKVNDCGIIPKPYIIQFKGERVYYREVYKKDFMRIFHGFGMSMSILEVLEDIPIIFKYIGKKTHYYKSHIKIFRNSIKVYTNTTKDIQKFVSVLDMQEVF